MAPHRHLAVVVTVTDSARTNTNAPHIGASLPLPGNLALGARHGKLDANIRTSALPGTPSVQSVHDHYPFALEDGGWLAPMAAELVDRLTILVKVRRFHGMGVVDARALRSDNYVRRQHFVRRTASVPFLRFWADVRREFLQCLLLFMVLWVPISATLCKRAMLMLWHAFMLLGLRFLPLFFFLLGGLCCFFL
jgi:hypothetical protein